MAHDFIFETLFTESR